MPPPIPCDLRICDLDRGDGSRAHCKAVLPSCPRDRGRQRFHLALVPAHQPKAPRCLEIGRRVGRVAADVSVALTPSLPLAGPRGASP